MDEEKGADIDRGEDHELIPHQPEEQDVEFPLRIFQRAYPKNPGSGTCGMVRSGGGNRGHEERSSSGGGKPVACGSAIPGAAGNVLSRGVGS